MNVLAGCIRAIQGPAAMAYLGHCQYHEHHSAAYPAFDAIEADESALLIRSMTDGLKTQGPGVRYAVAERDVSGHVARTRGSTVRHQEHSMRAIRQLGPAGGTSRLDAACDVLV